MDPRNPSLYVEGASWVIWYDSTCWNPAPARKSMSTVTNGKASALTVMRTVRALASSGPVPRKLPGSVLVVVPGATDPASQQYPVVPSPGPRMETASGTTPGPV